MNKIKRIFKLDHDNHYQVEFEKFGYVVEANDKNKAIKLAKSYHSSRNKIKIIWNIKGV